MFSSHKSSSAPQDDRPLVGVSRCLLGDRVRYDGKSKTNPTVLERLCQVFKLVPVCPEVEAGLSVPRPPVQLTGSIENPKLIGRDNSLIDITQIMQDYCETKPAELIHLSGFIFKSQSPSCGLNSTPVYVDGHCITETSRGIFAKNFCQAYPDMPVIEETELETATRTDDFIQAVLKHHTN